MNFYAEYREDEWIWKHIRIPARGFYVDLGCARPGHGSNTEFLREMGWDGLAIDGNADYAAHWEGKAKFVSAVVAPPLRPYFLKCSDASLSRAITEGQFNNLENSDLPGSALPVVGQPLDKLLAGHPINFIELLSIDVEGGELDALKTLDLDRYRPQIIISEYNTHGIGKDYGVFEYLMATGNYMAVHQSMANIIYLRR